MYFWQIGNYALHRGFFAKKHPENSLKFAYFVPSLFVLYLITLVILSPSGGEGSGPGFFPVRQAQGQNDILLLPLVFYFFGLVVDATIISWRWKNPLIGLGTAPLIAATHLCYGVRFVWGLMLPQLKK